MKILVTGANGLVGQALCSALECSGYQVFPAVRVAATGREVQIGEVNEATNWAPLLDLGGDVVVHLAAKMPMADGSSGSDTDQYHRINVLGTANFARQCAAKGVKRFVFMSTVKVLGEGRDRPYRSDDFAVPSDAYAISKWEAEQLLMQIAVETRMQVVILRPPLVYGPGVKGNFFRLIQVVDRKTPLPFGSIQNHRSLIYLGNLLDAIKLCLVHPAASGKAFMVSDGDDVSTPELIRRVAAALGRNTFLLPIPVAWMKWGATLLGRKSAVDRLVGSLAVDIAPIKADLGWSPPYSMQSGLASTMEWYYKSKVRL